MGKELIEYTEDRKDCCIKSTFILYQISYDIKMRFMKINKILFKMEL